MYYIFQTYIFKKENWWTHACSLLLWSGKNVLVGNDERVRCYINESTKIKLTEINETPENVVRGREGEAKIPRKEC